MAGTERRQVAEASTVPSQPAPCARSESGARRDSRLRERRKISRLQRATGTREEKIFVGEACPFRMGPLLYGGPPGGAKIQA